MSTAVTSDVDVRIRAALESVFDPCSVAQQVPVSIYDMGLVQGWTLNEEGHLRVDMCVTSFMCMMSPHFVEASKDELRKLPEVRSVDCVIDPTVLWTPDRMTETGRDQMAARRTRSLDVVPLRPRQWKEDRAAASVATGR